jgi:hypothetical protein
MLLVYAEEKAKANWIPAQWDNHMAAYVKFNQDLKRAGKMLGGEAFHPVSQATTVRIEAAGTVPTAGPFAETKEQLGGYYRSKPTIWTMLFSGRPRSPTPN